VTSLVRLREHPEVARLAERITRHEPAEVNEPGVRRAAVALIIRLNPETAEPEIFFIQRAHYETGPWSGQIAFPGGREEPGDESLVDTAVRETGEETGVELRRDLYPLEEIVGSALQRMEHQLDQRQVTTHLPDSLPLVCVDDVLLGQLVVNLLENATKYTPEGTPIEVAAEVVEDAITLEIRDRGPGFAPDEEQRIFEKFYRGRPDGRRVVRGWGQW